MDKVESSGVNCSSSLEAFTSTSTRNDITDDFKTQVLIVECVLGGVLLILVGCVIYLFCWGRKLAKLVKALDPMGTYKRVGPSIYLKKAQRDNASISSSFQHFNGRPEEIYSSENTSSFKRTKGNVGTLDRNFFTSTNFIFNNPLSNWDDPGKEANNPATSNNIQRRSSEAEVMEAITKIDNVLY